MNQKNARMDNTTQKKMREIKKMGGSNITNVLDREKYWNEIERSRDRKRKR